MRFHCTGTYCRNVKPSFVVGLGHYPPFDYRGACDVHVYSKRQKSIFSGRVGAGADPPTRIAHLSGVARVMCVSSRLVCRWFPILSPQSEMRTLWERSTLYATNLDSDGTIPELPPLTLDRKPRLFPHHSDESDSDYKFLKYKVEPAFAASGRVPIDVIRDDAFGKPLLLPPLEKALRDEMVDAAQHLKPSNYRRP